MDPNTDSNPAAEAQKRTAIDAEIRKLVTAAKLDHTAADSLIDRGATVDEARAELFDQLLQRGTPTVRHQRVEVGDRLDAPEKLVERMSEALTCRLTGGAPKDEARPYMHRRLVDMAAELLEARGERTRLWSPDTILTRAGMHTTGDFATLLTSTGNRVLLAAFEAAPNPLRSLARRTTITDFRTKTTVKLSEWPKLAEVNEHGEVTHGTRGEAKEAYALRTFANIFSLSRQALVNDDLGTFADFGRAAGRAAAETEADVLTALLTANSGTGVTLDDGNPLFHTTHGNVAGSGTAIDVAALAAARLAMRSQKGLDAVTPVNAVPRFLLVSPTKETQAEGVLAPLVPAQVSNVNPFAQRLDLLVEPRLSVQESRAHLPVAHIRRSFHYREVCKPKTRTARRTIELHPRMLELLRALRPLRPEPGQPVFPNLDGRRISPRVFWDTWKRCLEACRIRHRGLYALKDTFVTHTLARADEEPGRRDELIAFAVRQTGVREDTLRRHYERCWPRDREKGRRTYATLDASLEEAKLSPDPGTIRKKPYQTANRKWMMSPSCTT